MIDKNNLPPSWAIATFEDLLDYIQPTEYIVASTEYDDKYKTPVLTAGKSFIKGYTNETNGIFDAVPVIIFDDFTTATQFVNFPFKVKSSAMKILKPTSDLVNIKLAFYFMQTVHLKNETHKRYWISEYSQLSIPLPPHNEQQRIFYKIEEHFIILDKGIESLKSAQQQLKIYRQSVLKWAFEGKFTNEKVVDGVLPKGWELKKISEICDVVRGGSPRPAGDPKFYNGNIPFLKVADLTKDNKIYLHSFEYTIKEAGLQKTRKINPETLLLTNSGATLGVPKICMIDATMNDGVAAFLNLDKRSNLYCYYFWESKTGELRRINQGAAQPNLNTDIIKNYVIPYCSFEMQQKVVSQIESRLSVCDKILETIETSLQQSQALRLSIIKKGFEGKLVKQNAKDESAEILLAKIRAEIKKNNPDKPKKEVKIKTSKKKKELV
ncbi:MAG: restriction endonuclease subunit S [Bacteroidetes bacterium]|nr:restriction endonuclease subunit S [Bacteroidota bacterium]